MYSSYCTEGIYCIGRKHLCIMILLSEERLTIFDNCINNRRYREDSYVRTYMDPKMCASFNAFGITEFTKLRLSKIKSQQN